MISFSSLSRYFASAFTFYVGGGIGEAALIGAAFGGGKAIVTGEDPLKAALLGGVTGGAMSGLTQGAMGLIGPNSAAAGLSTEATNQVAKEAVSQGITSAAPGVNTALNVANTYNPALSSAVQSSVPQGIANVNTGLNVANTYNPALSSAGSQGIAAAPTVTAQQAVQQAAAEQALAQEAAKQAALPTTPNGPFVDLKSRFNPTPGSMLDKGFDFAIANPEITAGGAGAAYGMLYPPKMKEEEEKEEKSPLAGYDRDSFTPYDAPRPDPYPQAQYTDYFRGAKEGGVMRSYAQGGIADLAAEREMRGRSYPQGLYNSSRYAMASQSPISGDVVSDGYGPAINTYSGMAKGGIARFFPGGPTGNSGQVYYDSAKGQYYTLSPGSFGTAAMYGSNNTRNRRYIGDAPAATFGDVPLSVGRYKIDPIENHYRAEYSEQMAPREYTGPQGGVGRDYSLADSLPLLAATNPEVAALYASPAPEGTAEGTSTGTASTPAAMASGGIAGYNLGGYAAGGNPRLLKGPGDGMSDNIPATIGDRQPARLADGEFVVPADVVSHLGNGSTDAGAKHLYNMMDRVRKARTGNKKQGKQIKPNKFLPR